MSAFRVGDRVDVWGDEGSVIQVLGREARLGVEFPDGSFLEMQASEATPVPPQPPVDDASFAAALEERGWKSYPCAYYTDGEWGLRAGRLQAPLDDIRTGAPTLAEARRRVIELVDEREALRGGDDG